MKQRSEIQNLIISFIMFSFIFSSSFVAKCQLPDKKMEAKYGLTIPPVVEKFEPAPEWLQKADMFTMCKGVWKDYKFTLKDTVITRIVRVRADYAPIESTEQYPVETISSFDGSQVKGVSLISHVPHCKTVFEEAHKQGFKVIPYVHFMDIHSNYADQDVFLFQHPEILLKDENGKWVHTPMDGSYRVFRFLTCANSPSNWKLSLDYVKKMMDWGADGIFIDNVDNRIPCQAAKFETKNPEFPSYIHEHLFPDATQDYAWDRLLQSIRILVKSYGNNKIVILNSGIGTQFQKDGDCCMWESFIYSWAWEGRQQSWEDVKKFAQDNAWYLNSGRRITCLSYLNPKRKEVKEDAFWAFSAARLVDFVWWADLNGTGAENLYQCHLGKGLEPFKEIKGLAYRTFENGLIVLNDSEEDQNVLLTLPDGFQPKHMVDIIGTQIIRVNNKKVNVTVSKKSARICLCDPKL